MGALRLLAVAGAGGLGAVSRLIVDGFVKSRVVIAYPLGTTVINISGSFLLGLVTGLATAGLLPPDWRAVIGIGFIGGYTTFSTASFETVRLAQEGRYRAATVNAFGMLAGALLAAGLGLWIGWLL
ncbi:fluoride efflux transporter CrcB [Leifsonia aquatica]|uniref:fluoride efflux transporter CrcB n=1 Tax=Leifsonia aquatica TaxID=144185 RepID=UPI0004695E40|nr:fluoride efflux transporter CrcB [Leifsonia aquatica]